MSRIVSIEMGVGVPVKTDPLSEEDVSLLGGLHRGDFKELGTNPSNVRFS